MNIEGLPVATGQNLKRPRAASGWGQRHIPRGRVANRQCGGSTFAIIRKVAVSSNALDLSVKGWRHGTYPEQSPAAFFMTPSR
ncbi:MAG: hypothetical protein M3354_12115 [Chloroflexota bacterium]|nr:hypothetical protein [Chloroflexota bacterium]